MISTFDEALKYIKELESENRKLKEEIKILKERKKAGRKKHNEAWTASYKEFVNKYNRGMSVTEIVESSEFSRRTAYRYLAYYQAFGESNKKLKGDSEDENID